MIGNTQKYTLGELCHLITDGKHGDCRNEPGSGYYFLSVKDVVGGQLVYEGARQITKQDFLETHRRTNLMPGDILFTNTGTIGRMALAPDHPRTRRTTFQKSVAILKPKPEFVLPRYLYYLLRAEHARICEYAAGTTQKNLLLKDFRTFELEVPALGIQRAIAHILGSLDDKIELNRRMNATLEAMAQATFKSWFVDFDPVRAKMKGRRPYGMDADTAGLFPSRLVDSGTELGMIPEGWEVKALSETIDIIGGGTPKTSIDEYWGGNILWYSVVDAPHQGELFVINTEKNISEIGLGNSSAKVVPANTTIISARGTVGKCALTGQPMTFNQSCYAIRPRERRGDYHVYWTIRHSVSNLASKGHGSVFNTITRNTFESIMIAKPKSQVISAFDQAVDQMMLKILANQKQSQTLAALRDTLLPRLMSGELRLGEAEEMVEGV